MSTEGSGTVSCPACGTRYPWTEQLIGRKVRCRCGTVFEAAFDLTGGEAPAALEPEMDETYDIAGPVTSQPPVAPASPLIEPPDSQVLAYRRIEPTPAEPQRSNEGGGMIDLYLPLLLLIVGVGLRGMQVVVGAGSGHALYALGMVILGIVLNVGLTFAAVVLAGRFLGVDFGNWRDVTIKLIAIGTLAGAVGSVVAGMDLRLGNGPVIALHLVILIYWVMFYVFFDLDVQESLLTVVIVMAFQIAAFCIVFTRV